MVPDTSSVVEKEKLIMSKNNLVDKKTPDIKNTYIFPKKVGKWMKNVDMRIQLEASILSLSLLLCGMTMYIIFAVFFSTMSGFQKFMLVFNLVCGLVMLGTYLITNFQQYQSYMDAMGIDTDAEKRAIKKSGNIFKRIINALKNKRSNKKVESIISNLSVNEIKLSG